MLDYKEFENKEIDRFMEIFFPYEHTRLLLINLSEREFPYVKKETKKGIEKAVENYLKSQNPIPDTLYKANLLDFYHTNNVKQEVDKNVKDLNPHLIDVGAYSEEVAAAYRSYIFNESSDKFKKEFSTK